MNTSSILTKSLADISYGGENISLPASDKNNLYMGIGLWSNTNGLSQGLPIDVIKMLLAAAIMRLLIVTANPDRKPKITLLIADSLAIAEGADAGKVRSLVSVYKQCLKPLLKLLNIHEDTKIVRAAKLTATPEYQAIKKEVKNEIETNPSLLEYSKGKDPEHYRYIRTQTAITEYMYRHADVGVKVGWRKKECKVTRTGKISMIQWDELKFDAIYRTVCPQSNMSNLYTRAGLKMEKIEKQKEPRLTEGCPYTSYSPLQRYVMQSNGSLDIKTVWPVTRGISNQWLNVVKICNDLNNSLGKDVLPSGCLSGNNTNVWVYRALNYWVNMANQTTLEIAN